jgi:acid phosphatase
MIGLLAGCAVHDKRIEAVPPADPASHENLDSVLWTQTAAEYEILAEMVFRQARFSLDRALEDSGWSAALEQQGSFAELPPAVIVDVDETILSNAPLQGELIRERVRYNSATWKKWVALRDAEPIAGAAEFLEYAHSRNVTVFYITNRDHDEEEDTRANLAKFGLPLRDDIDVILTRKEKNWDSSDKSPRRAHACEKFRVLLLVGDDLNDFAAGARDIPENRRLLAAKYRELWGSKWILVPNAMYGSWESALYGHRSGLSGREILEEKMARLRGF